MQVENQPTAKVFYVGVKGVIVIDDKILLLKRSSKEKLASFWDMPGGRIVGDENFEIVLKRELIEELGDVQKVSVQDLLHVFRLPYDVEEKYGLLLLFFKVTVAIEAITLSEEHESYRWVHKNDIAHFLTSEEKYLNDGVKKVLQLAFA